MANPLNNEKKIDMSLRLWSDCVPLGPVIEKLNVAASHLHVINRPMAKEGHLAARLARRHYASTPSVTGHRDADVSEWCKLIVAKIASQKCLVDFLAAGQVEGVLWITTLGNKPAPMPNIASDIVTAAAQLKLSILLENYTDLEREVPEKLWLCRAVERE